jgi:transcriptional regulator
VLIHPWDEATREEWQGVLARADFGQLVTAGHVDGYPVVVPTHFLYDGADTVLLHLARPNPVWRALDADPHVVLSLAGDYAYVEAAWNANPGTDPDRGVPTSYYTAVQLLCSAEVVDDPDEKAAILAEQLTHFEPADSTRATPSADDESDRRQLPGIRGLRLHIESVRAKMKYGGNKTPEHRLEIADHLTDRDGPMDAAARDNLLRRLDDQD